MRCKVCGFVSENMMTTCPNCGSSSIENSNVINSEVDNNSTNTIKCPKCGYQNYVNEIICKNCEYSLNEQTNINNQANDVNKDNCVKNINKNEELMVNTKKNIFLFILFSIIYLIVPFLVVVGETIFLSNKVSNELSSSPISIIILLMSLLILMFGVEPLTCLTVKKIVKNTNNMKKELMIFEIVMIVLLSLILLLIDLSSYFAVIIFILIRILVWFITRKIFINEKIIINKKIVALLVVYIALLLIIPNFILPTKLNKTLFNIFGTTNFSSKKFHIELIENYNINNEYGDDFSYFHELTVEELNKITKIYIDQEYNDTDIKKLNNLHKIVISDDAKTNSNIDLSDNKKLTNVSISSSNVKNIKLPNSVTIFYCDNTLEEFDISELKEIEELEVKTKKLKANSLDQLKKISYMDDITYNTLIINNTMFGLKKGYMASETNRFQDKYILYIPEYTKVSDIITNNLKVKVMYDKFPEGMTERKINDEINYNDKIFIYDNNDNLLITLNIYTRGDY